MRSVSDEIGVVSDVNFVSARLCLWTTVRLIYKYLLISLCFKYERMIFLFLVVFPSDCISKGKPTASLMSHRASCQDWVSWLHQRVWPKRTTKTHLWLPSCSELWQYLNQVSQPRRYWHLGLDHLFLRMLSCVWRLFSSISSLYPQDASTMTPTMITLAVSRLCQIVSWGREGQSHPPPIESLWSTLGEPTSDSKI